LTCKQNITTNNRYLVRYLPQHRIRAQAALTQLLDCNLLRPALEGTSLSAPLPTTPLSNFEATTSGQAVDLERLNWSRFTESFCLSLPTASQQLHIQDHFVILRPAITPSHHKLLVWLQALQQLFQNMAWDRWQYRNGIPKYLQD